MLVPAMGVAAFSLILPMTLVILFVMVLVLLVLPRDRHGLHQAGRIVRGGARELRPAHRAGVRGRAAHRLRGDRGGPDRGGYGRRGLRVPVDRPLQARDLRRRGPAHVLREPAGPEGGGPVLCDTDLPVRGRGHLDDHRRADPRGAGEPAARRPGHAARRLRSRLRLGRADHGRDDLHPAPRVRQRRRVADRHRGGLGRRGRVPAARGAERAPGAHGRGRDPRHPGGGHLLAGARHARHAVQAWLSRPCWPRRPSSSSGLPSWGRLFSIWSRLRPCSSCTPAATPASTASRS